MENDKMESIQLRVPRSWAKKILMLLEEDFKETKKTIDSPLAKRDFHVYKAIEIHYNAEDHMINDIKKQLKKQAKIK